MAVVNLVTTVSILGVFVLLAHQIFSYLRSPLRKLPGPRIAKFTNLWRLKTHYDRTHVETQIDLHAKYGDVVQLGPNVVSVANPNMIKTIYSTRGTFPKSEFYSVNDAMQPDGTIVENIFGTRNNEFHSRQIRPIQKMYSLQSAQKLEPVLDNTFDVLCRELERQFMDGKNEGKTCDIADWVLFFAWDFLGDVTFSQRFGFIEAGEDVGGMLDTAERVMRYFSVVGQIPTFDKLLAKNRYFPFKFPDFSGAAGFCVERFSERMQNFEAMKGNKDFLSGFLQVQQEYPSVTVHDVIGWLIINILGGADTTAIVMKALFYHILKSPYTKNTLVTELKAANLTYPPSYASLSGLPYLSACIKEGLRMHPVIGQIAERVVPLSSPGLTIPYPHPDSDTSVTLPPGTIVGMNPWVVHRQAATFGSRPDDFIPERWMQGYVAGEGVQEWEGRVKRMTAADMSFGNGNRTCLGRPLALVELYKLVATLFGKYEIELEDPNQEWELHKQWFVWPHKIRVQMRPH
ncbi:cytochrome P450 [Massarina eburnea CBS 473.64]|uniref:Cytochrome P450 n=1 Tax=Massarina eburnea CBS 473.64 TaxID=1395130 RepID=A0A6A6RUJ6_9PLEO|nr:cytochrome P450 [Massarina eburnea CBS 473.64]